MLDSVRSSFRKSPKRSSYEYDILVDRLKFSIVYPSSRVSRSIVSVGLGMSVTELLDWNMWAANSCFFEAGT